MTCLWGLSLRVCAFTLQEGSGIDENGVGWTLKDEGESIFLSLPLSILIFLIESVIPKVMRSRPVQYHLREPLPEWVWGVCRLIFYLLRLLNWRPFCKSRKFCPLLLFAQMTLVGDHMHFNSFFPSTCCILHKTTP